MDSDIKVSICCTAYNAEKYISECIDGFLLQKCNFNFEIIIHDDASTDQTATIIRKYEQRFPNLIHGIYQDKNQWSKIGFAIYDNFIFPIVKGKYIALCEGDDYWTSADKLQKQFDAMEQHPECSLSVHRVVGVYEDGKECGVHYPNFTLSEGILSSRKFVDLNCTNEYVFQTSSYFMRTSIMKQCVDERLEFRCVSATADLAWMLYFATKGSIYYYPDEMSCYRWNSLSSAERKRKEGTTEKALQAHFDKQIRMMKAFDEYTNNTYHNYCVRKIDGYYFDQYVRNSEYRKMISPRFRYFRRNYSFKAKIKLYLYAFIPALMRSLEKKL